ncbi:hypothetical protein CCHR01_14949 [Colletotrichum chrysophilum]|uniref:Uncharacterized protein n=1 Tax=Colletotrichum chrysophilum TaxID=1836956 RepID=A0AAD9A6J6_9PEZI|nr:hypothetical protein CCHR01_14949 [Colletotrichum chrysophilum]
MGERTGSRVFQWVWSNVLVIEINSILEGHTRTLSLRMSLSHRDASAAFPQHVRNSA